VAEPVPERRLDDADDKPPAPPTDPDIGTEEIRTGPAGHSRAGMFPPAARSRWPRIHWRSVAAVGVGGFFGGVARYALGLAWPAHGAAFPWATFTINTTGAFLLALLLIVVLEVLPPTTYLRPGLGTGFCGAYTTFSSVAVAADQFTAHGRATLAAGYVGASVFAGLAAASFGMILGRSIAASRKE
jgi:CrcB protein